MNITFYDAKNEKLLKQDDSLFASLFILFDLLGHQKTVS